METQSIDLRQFRFHHIWVLGKTGVGKSTTLINFALQDVENGDGILFIDPHGENIDALLSRIPKERWKDVIVFDPSDIDNPIGFNILKSVSETQRPFVASSVVDTFKSVWGYDNLTTPTLDQYLYNTTAALLDAPDGTLMGIKFMLTSERYRDRIIKFVEDPIVREFWLKEYAELSDRDKRETPRSTLNKIGMLLSDPRIRNVIGQKKNSLNLPKAMADRKIVLVRLPQGQLGIQKAATIGALILSYAHTSALSRKDRAPFHIFIDEVHHFGTASLIEMLSGIRKFGVSLTLCHQYLDQLSPQLQSALMGNIGTKIFFKTGIKDSSAVEAEFETNNILFALHELNPFEARVSTPYGDYNQKMPELKGIYSKRSVTEIWSNSRTKFGSRKTHVERDIMRFIKNA